MKKAGMFVLSLLLLAVDMGYRYGKLLLRLLAPPFAMALRLAFYAAVMAVVFLASLSFATKLPLLMPFESITWRDIAFMSASALIVLSIFGMSWLLVRSITAVGMSLAARLTEVASRPIVINENTHAAARPPERAHRSGSGDFVGYTDEAAALNEMREDLLTKGISEENIAELLKEVGKGAEV